MKHIATHLLGFAMCFFYIHTATAQIYNPATNKVIAGQIGEVVWKDGIHNGLAARFGTLIAKENRYSNSSRQIGIPVIYVEPADTSAQELPVFVLGGGPGESNLNNTMFFEQLAQKHPIIMTGYRGVDGTVRLDCEPLSDAILNKDLTLGNAKGIFKNSADSAMKIWRKQLIDIQGYSMQEVTNDIEDIRKALNFDKIQIVSFSYGTMIAQMYTQLHPEHVDKNVMIAPRMLFDFNIHPSDIADLDQSINRYLPPEKHYVIKRSINAYKNADGQDINQIPYLLFTFSKLYSTEGIMELTDLVAQTENGDWNNWRKSYNNFLKTHLEKIVLGDVIVKRTNADNAEKELETDTEYDTLANAVNYWFSPANGVTSASSYNGQGLPPILVICGDLDIVSTSSDIMDNFSAHYKKIGYITIDYAGHADLISTQRGTIEIAISKFLKE